MHSQHFMTWATYKVIRSTPYILRSINLKHIFRYVMIICWKIDYLLRIQNAMQRIEFVFSPISLSQCNDHLICCSPNCEVTYIISAQILELLWGLLTSLTVATYQIYTDNEHNVLKTVLLVGWNILRFSPFRIIESLMILTEEGILIPVSNTIIAPTVLLNKRISVEVSSILIL